MDTLTMDSRAERQAETKRTVAKIRAIHAGHQGAYGAPRVHAELRALGWKINRKRVARLMRINHIIGRHLRRKKRTTIAARATPPVPDLVMRDFTATVVPGGRPSGFVRSLGWPRHLWGNYIILDLGAGVYTGFAHLKRGSLRVASHEEAIGSAPVGLRAILKPRRRAGAPRIVAVRESGTCPGGFAGLPRRRLVARPLRGADPGKVHHPLRSRSGSWAARLSSHSCSVIPFPLMLQLHL
ncbi:IS3 family transposase [Streptomyces sp. NPDC059017]|uniref:IS3 family transposase n=1 Tax=Streptomyces sp. NPDC059017 TaxID=3346700 RepID=UPI0036A3D0E9